MCWCFMWRERKKPISSQLAKFSILEMSIAAPIAFSKEVLLVDEEAYAELDGAASLAAMRSARVASGEYASRFFGRHDDSTEPSSPSKLLGAARWGDRPMAGPGEEGRVRAGGSVKSNSRAWSVCRALPKIEPKIGPGEARRGSMAISDRGECAETSS